MIMDNLRRGDFTFTAVSRERLSKPRPRVCACVQY